MVAGECTPTCDGPSHLQHFHKKSNLTFSNVEKALRVCLWHYIISYRVLLTTGSGASLLYTPMIPCMGKEQSLGKREPDPHRQVTHRDIHVYRLLNIVFFLPPLLRTYGACLRFVTYYLEKSAITHTPHPGFCFVFVITEARNSRICAFIRYRPQNKCKKTAITKYFLRSPESTDSTHHNLRRGGFTSQYNGLWAKVISHADS